MDKFLDMYNTPRINQEEIENSSNETVSVKKQANKQKTPKKQKSRTQLSKMFWEDAFQNCMSLSLSGSITDNLFALFWFAFNT